MYKKILTLAIIVSFGLIANAQTANLILFTENGEQFTAILNGIKQNAKPETNVKITGLNAEYYKLKVIFDNQALGERNFNVNLALGEETTYSIKKNNKGEYVTRFVSNVPLDQAPSTPPTQTVVVYNANPAATSNLNTTVTHQQTTTTTTNGTADPDNVNINMGINIDGMGGSINMNVSGADIGSSSTVHSTTTTTTTTTHSSTGNHDDHAGHNHPHNPAPAPAPVVYLPGYNGPIGCPVPMSPNDFSDLKRTVNSKTFEDTKLTIAKQVVSSQCLLTNQVKDLLGCFTFEANKLEMAKNCYTRTCDIGNYFKVNDVFTFESSIEELNEYIESRK